MARSISVVVPTLNDDAELQGLLASVDRLDVLEIIVVDASRRPPPPRPGGREIVIRASQPGRGRQIAEGARRASGDLLWILHADTRPPESAVADIQRILSDPAVALGCFPLRFDRAHPVLWLSARLSRLDGVGLTFGDQGFFMRHADYEAVGGAPDWALFEDVELRRRLKTLGRVKKARDPVRTSARRFLSDGPLRRQIGNAWLLARFLAGADPDRLAASYRSGRHRPQTRPKRFSASSAMGPPHS
ncbi:MAG: glycosyltransferase [Pseudomonadota bacterium]